jgi:catechol 2,3-dioxygenase-like lactoylglutathione lyase family enzyme
MIDHTGLTVTDFAVSKAFYEAALAPLGYGVLMAFSEGHHHVAGLGETATRKPDFWIHNGPETQSPNMHIAFAAKDRATVDAFYRAALAAGGRDNGAPGLRPHYHADYYGAFVLDPDGHNIEACCHRPE